MKLLWEFNFQSDDFYEHATFYDVLFLLMNNEEYWFWKIDYFLYNQMQCPKYQIFT